MQLGGECQQFQRAHLAVRIAMLRQVGECTAGLGAIDLYPTTADLNQVGPLLRRAP